MLRQIKKIIAESPILEVTSFISFGLVVKLASGFVVSKLSAVFLGAKGLALIGNLRNALLVLQNISTIGLNKGVVKYSSEYKDDAEKFKVFISTLMWLLLLVSVLTFVIIFFFSDQLAIYVFEDKSFNYIFKLTAVLLPIYAINTFLIAILQGFEKFKKVVRINIFIHVLNLVLFSYLIYEFGLNGALIAIVVVPSASLIITLFLANQEIQIWHYFDLNVFSRTQLRHFGQYALMTLISAVSFPMVYLLIRQAIADAIDIDAAGYWEACFRLSAIYLLFIQYLLNLYILPKLVQAKTRSQFRAIIFDYYRQIVPLFAFGLLVIFILRDYIIWLVFSKEFLPVTEIIGWQIIADLFRVVALVLTYQFHAKKMIWHYILTDLFLALCLYFSAIYGLKYFELRGVVIGHAVTYALYFLLILFIFRNAIFGTLQSENQ